MLRKIDLGIADYTSRWTRALWAGWKEDVSGGPDGENIKIHGGNAGTDDLRDVISTLDHGPAGCRPERVGVEREGAFCHPIGLCLPQTRGHSV